MGQMRESFSYSMDLVVGRSWEGREGGEGGKGGVMEGVKGEIIINNSTTTN